MSNRDIRNRRNKRRRQLTKRQRTLGIIVIVLILYLFLKPTINIISGGLRTTLPSAELLVESIDSEGFFIKSERVYKSHVKGIVNKSLKEGERVSAGSKVGNINELEDKSSLRQEIEEIEKSIRSLEKFEDEIDRLEANEENIKESDIKRIKAEKMQEIQDEIISNNYRYIDIYKEEFSIYGTKREDEDSKEDFASGIIEALEARKDKIRKEIKDSNINYYTQNAGIISYEIDDYEETFVPENLDTYTFRKLDKLDFQEIMDSSNEKQTPNEEIDIGYSIYKLIDDFEWYLAIKIDEIENLKDLDVNQSISVKIDDKETEVKGFISNINKSKNEAVIMLKFDTMLDKYYNKRVAMIELIKSKTNSLKIPKKSLIEKKDKNGVYIKSKGGIVEFRQVFAIKEIDDYVYIKPGDNNSDVYTGEDSEAIRTVTLFDEIILSPRGIKEGDIID